RAGVDREILAADDAGAAGDAAEAEQEIGRGESVRPAILAALGGFGGLGAAGDRADLAEAARVQQAVHALADRQPAAIMLAVDGGRAAQVGGRAAAALDLVGLLAPGHLHSRHGLAFHIARVLI